MAPGLIEKGFKCSSNPHGHARCKLCGEETNFANLRHDIHEADETSDSVPAKKTTHGTVEALYQRLAQHMPDDSAEIPNHTAEALQVDKVINPGKEGPQSSRDTFELEADSIALSTHQNHLQGNKESADGAPPRSSKDPKLPTISENDARTYRSFLATNAEASLDLKEYFHKKTNSSGENPDFTDHRTSPPVVKNLYFSHGPWSEYANAEIEAKELQRISEMDDIVHRQVMRSDVNNSGQLWVTHSVAVRGRLKALLQTRVFKDHPDVGGLIPHELLLSQPFTPVVHRWKMLVDLSNELTRPFGIETLMGIIFPCVEGKLSVIKHIRSSNFCSWEDLNLILSPGEIVLSQKHASKQPSRFSTCTR